MLELEPLIPPCDELPELDEPRLLLEPLRPLDPLCELLDEPLRDEPWLLDDEPLMPESRFCELLDEPLMPESRFCDLFDDPLIPSL